MIHDLTKKEIAYEKRYDQFGFSFNHGNIKADNIEENADRFQNIYWVDRYR